MSTTSRGDGASPLQPRAVAYLRVATDQQAKGELAQQLIACRQWCQENHVVLSHWHIDAISGGSACQERPGLIDALAELRTGDVLLVSRFDRLSRGDWREMLRINRAVEIKGCRIQSATGLPISDVLNQDAIRALCEGGC